MTVTKCLAILLFMIVTNSASAYKLSFDDNQDGIIVGASTFFNVVPTVGLAYDPVSAFATTDTVITGADSGYVIPAKLGYYLGLGGLGIDIYGVYITNIQNAFTATGDTAGSGSILYGGYGAGLSINTYFFRNTLLRAGLVFNTEYVRHRANISYTPTDGAATHLKAGMSLPSGAVLLSGDLWLGDLWSLALGVGYRYSSIAKWAALANGTTLEQVVPITTKAGQNSQQHGLVVDVSFRLALYDF